MESSPVRQAEMLSARRHLLELALAVLCLCLLLAPPATAAQVELVRVYRSDQLGAVFEVCKGTFEPPSTDPANPAYCQGQTARWSESRWRAYNAAQSPASGSGEKEGTTEGKGKPQPSVVAGTAPEAGSMPQAAPPYGGSLDPTAVLGIENPFCGEPGQLSAAQVRNCRSSHSPEASYPIGNYGWDIHIEAGGFISSLFAPAVSFVVQLLSVIWLLLLMMLKGCLIILGFAFSLSPFTDNRVLDELSTGLSRFFNQLTAPWFSALFVMLGGWGMYQGIVRRRTGETIAGMLMALAMMLAALWVIHSPRETVGRVAEAVNGASLAAVSVPASGQTGTPIHGYNDAMASVWDQMTAIPFCAMNFSDVHWCMTAKPSEDALDAARDGLDDGDAFAEQLLAGLPSQPELATKALAHDLRGLFGPAPTVRDLYLRFSPLSGPRDKLWDYYNGEPDEHVGLPLNIGPQLDIGGGTSGAAPDKVAMQGRGGVLTRIVLVLVFAIGLLGGVLLLLWLAMRLVMATASAIVLVLAAPLAMFFPAFGQAGRNAFTRWGTSLLGAIASKFIFSGLLGVTLLGSRVIGDAAGRSSPTLGLVAVMAFWWACFLQREKLLSVFEVDPNAGRDAGIYRTLAGGYLGYRVAKAAKGSITHLRDEHRERVRHRDDETSRLRRHSAERDLDRQAHQRLDVATSKAESRESARSEIEHEARALGEDADVHAFHRDPSSLGEPERRQAEAKASRLTELKRQIESSRPQAQADRRLLERVRANEASGLPRHGKSEVQGAREAIRREAHLPAEAPEHRWRAEAAGRDPAGTEGREAIAQSLAATRSAIGATASDRLEQVDLHRRPQTGGDQRRPESGLRRPPPRGGPNEGRGDEAPGTPRAHRRSRVRNWLSR